jgi:CheY-like chemotaxis protein
MQTLLGDIEFWKLLAGMAWPIAALIMFFVLRNQILRLFDREEMDIEVAGLKLHVRDATKQLGTQLADLTGRVAAIESGQRPVSGDSPARIGRHFSILWVDDYPSNNAFLVEKFRIEGMEVELSMSTSDAMARLDVRTFDIVLSDLGRVEGGVTHSFAGLELLERLSAKGLKIPVAIYAGPRGVVNEKKLKKAGAALVAGSTTDLIRFVESARRASETVKIDAN